MFKMTDVPEFRKMSRTQRNRRNKARRRERKKEWKANNPKPERVTTPKTTPESVSDVLKAISANRKKAKR